ncbi:hypothetical protein ACFY7H_24570 [Streptomyces sp. NPDC012794]|uniref:hypothetical protein n=1 Tax=Streptomyces sp. NPDC012794 TaxID=3364850 RepID=UPI0036A16EA7
MAHNDDQLTQVAFGFSEATASIRADALRLLETDAGLHAEWVAGLASNHAAPDSVLRRLFTLDPRSEAWSVLGKRELSQTAAMAAAKHPDPEVRSILVGNSRLPAKVYGALAEDTNPAVQRRMVRIAQSFGVELPTEVLVRLATSPYAGLRCSAAELVGLPEKSLLLLAEDRDARVRAAAINSRTWHRLPVAVRAAAGADPDPRVREAFERVARLMMPLPTTVDAFLAEADEDRRLGAALAAPVDAELAAFLATQEDPSLRERAARNPHVPTPLALALAADADAGVRLAVSTRADLTEEQRATIDYTAPQDRYPVPAWVEEHFDDPDALREIAASSHVMLRRGVTRAAELPADVIERLAGDEDHYVRSMLCENDHAPHELLVEMLADSPRWVLLTSRRHFARPGLARFADSPNHRLRYAAMRDPHAVPELVERLSHDPNDMVRHHAASHPLLPLPRLVELLGVTAQNMARTAARNHALPYDLMRQLLDVAGVER